jgi:hypothetical protein
MTFPADPPRLPKWIFLLGDAALLGAAVFIGTHAAHPTNGAPLIAIVVCVALGAICATLPFVLDFTRSQEEAVDERRRALEGLARTVTSSAEQVAITANGLHQIAELAQKNLKHAEQLTDHLREKIAELQAQVAEARESDREEIARLESASDKITKAVGDGAKLEAAVRKGLAAAVAEFETKAAAASSSIAEKAAAALAARTPAAAPAPVDTPAASAAAPRNGAGHSRESPVHESVPEAKPAPLDKPAPPNKPAPVEESAAATTTAEASAQRKRIPKKISHSEPSLPLEGTDLPARSDEVPEPAVSTDGATRVLVTAYIGIGNRLFIRGDGPGLARDKGVPLQFVSIGKWRWETSDATAPVKFRLYKNDETECPGLGECSVGPGRQQELTAAF